MEINGGYLASDKYSNSINDGEDFEIMELPVFQFGQLWGPDALLEYIYIEPYRCERLETPEPASLLQNLHCTCLFLFLHRSLCPKRLSPFFLPLVPTGVLGTEYIRNKFC